MTEKEYQRRVNELLPRSETGPMCLKAFLVGGVICCLGSVTGFEGDGNGAMYGTAKSGLFNFVSA